MSKLSQKVALITGGTSGMGLETAKLFLKEGAKVVITGRNEEVIQKLSQEFNPESFWAVKADAANIQETPKLLAAVEEKFGKIDILFLNAGIAQFAPITEVTEDLYDSILNINLKGPLFTIKYATTHLNEDASIILNTSVSNQKGMLGSSVYAASKAALRSLVRVAAAELAGQKVRVNAISPGPIETPIWEKTGQPREAIEQLGEGLRQQVALQRFGKAEEVANAALFLASEASSYITGTELVVDGGLSQV